MINKEIKIIPYLQTKEHKWKQSYAFPSSKSLVV
jgi:hypothetical protein